MTQGALLQLSCSALHSTVNVAVEPRYGNPSLIGPAYAIFQHAEMDSAPAPEMAIPVYIHVCTNTFDMLSTYAAAAFMSQE